MVMEKKKLLIIGSIIVLIGGIGFLAYKRLKEKGILIKIGG
jgi:multisubunit Na+/H+ antiporter MnhG subunit